MKILCLVFWGVYGKTRNCIHPEKFSSFITSHRQKTISQKWVIDLFITNTEAEIPRYARAV